MKRTLQRSSAMLPGWLKAPASTGRQEQAAELKPIEVTGEPLPWRGKIARWPDEERERWGVLANALEDQGLDWRQAEEQAYRDLFSRGQGKPDDEEPDKMTSRPRGRVLGHPGAIGGVS